MSEQKYVHTVESYPQGEYWRGPTPIGAFSSRAKAAKHVEALGGKKVVGWGGRWESATRMFKVRRFPLEPAVSATTGEVRDSR